MVWCGPADSEAVELDQRRNVGPDVERDHAALREQLTGRRDEAERRRASAASQRDSAERQVAEWTEQRDRYDQMLRKLGEVAP